MVGLTKHSKLPKTDFVVSLKTIFNISSLKMVYKKINYDKFNVTHILYVSNLELNFGDEIGQNSLNEN